MRNRFLSLSLFCFTYGWLAQPSISAAQDQSERADDLMTVYAKSKIYHDDGTRSYTEYKPYATRTVALLPGFDANPAQPTALSGFGGLSTVTLEATGYYHVQKVEGRWWAVDPSGHPFIHMAVNSINTGDSERNQKALEEKFGNEQTWMQKTVRMLRAYGFNGAGSWSDAKAIRETNAQTSQPLAYTVNLNFMSAYADERGGTWQVPGHKAYPNDAIFVFDPAFKTFCDKHARQVIQYRDDPNLFGYFSDNEMPFKKEVLIGYLTLENKEDAGYLAARAWLKERGVEEKAITEEVKDAFRAYVGEQYFSVVRSAIKKYDPNHMYLGPRFYSGEKHNKTFMQSAGKYLDVVSCNYYNHWTPDSLHMAEWTRWTNKPFIVTEYYTKGEDSGLSNQSGAGWIVKTQQDRGLFYQNFCLALLASGNCVGWHYFKYQDNDPTLKRAEPSNEDANKGIVDNYYQVYEPMMNKMKELNKQVYHLIEYFDQ